MTRVVRKMPKNVVRYLSDVDCRRIRKSIDSVLAGNIIVAEGERQANAIVRRARKAKRR